MVADQLSLKYGSSFKAKNLQRMRQFAELYPNAEIVVSLTRQLSWTHVIALLPLKTEEARRFYAHKIATEKWSTRFARKQIEQKTYERNQIAGVQLAPSFPELAHTFKDPYFLDFLGLKDGYLENDLESAILKELESFILELGVGFSFVARQKRMVIDGEDFYLDLLFYHRKLRRLVAIELKIGKFKAADKGQWSFTSSGSTNTTAKKAKKCPLA